MDDHIRAAYDVAVDALADFPLGARPELEFVKYRENVVFRVDDGDAQYALRIARPGYRTDAQVSSEVAFVRELRRAGIRVPDFVPTKDGRDLTVRTRQGRRHQILLQHWVRDAGPLDDIARAFDGTSTLGPDDFAEVGALAARAHDASRRIGRVPGYDRPAWDHEGLVGRGALWGDPTAIGELGADEIDALQAARESLTLLLLDVGTGDDVYGVLHADFTPENILRSRDGTLTLIDFDDFGEGWHAFDLATTLFFYQPHPRYAEFREAMCNGYAAARAEHERTLRLLDPLLLARGLTYLGWAGERRGDDTAEFLVAEAVPLVLDLARRHLIAHDSGRIS